MRSHGARRPRLPKRVSRQQNINFVISGYVEKEPDGTAKTDGVTALVFHIP